MPASLPSLPAGTGAPKKEASGAEAMDKGFACVWNSHFAGAFPASDKRRMELLAGALVKRRPGSFVHLVPDADPFLAAGTAEKKPGRRKSRPKKRRETDAPGDSLLSGGRRSDGALGASHSFRSAPLTGIFKRDPAKRRILIDFHFFYFRRQFL